MSVTASRALHRAGALLVRFYKMDHLHDPVPLPNGRIRLGVEECKPMLRAGIMQADLDRRDNIILAVGGITAKDGLADRLCWGGIPVERLAEGLIDSDNGFYLAERGPLEWRQRFPRAARYVDRVNQGHHVWAIPLPAREEFIGMFEWGKHIEAQIGRTRAPQKRPSPGTYSRCGPGCRHYRDGHGHAGPDCRRRD